MCTDDRLVYADVHNTVQLKATAMRKDALLSELRKHKITCSKHKTLKVLKEKVEKALVSARERQKQKDRVQLCGQHKGMIPSALCSR